MGHEFDSQIEVGREREGVFSADLSAGWVVGGGVNGGYLLAVIGNALRASLPGKPDPLAVSAYYLSASVPGPATVAVDVRRDGGSVATAAADLAPGRTTPGSPRSRRTATSAGSATTCAPPPRSRACRRPRSACRTRWRRRRCGRSRR